MTRSVRWRCLLLGALCAIAAFKVLPRDVPFFTGVTVGLATALLYSFAP